MVKRHIVRPLQLSHSLFDIRLLATGEKKIETARLLVNVVEKQLIELLANFDWAFVECIDDNIVLSSRVPK
jgi:hypothetical protein